LREREKAGAAERGKRGGKSRLPSEQGDLEIMT